LPVPDSPRSRTGSSLAASWGEARELASPRRGEGRELGERRRELIAGEIRRLERIELVVIETKEGVPELEALAEAHRCAPGRAPSDDRAVLRRRVVEQPAIVAELEATVVG
jgi:hypothetical protein